MCIASGRVITPFENAEEEEIIISNSDKSRLSTAEGIKNEKYLYRLLKNPGSFCKKDARIFALFKNSLANFLSYKTVYIGASGNISCKTFSTLSAPPILSK